MSSYGSQHAFPTQSPYSPYPQPNSTYFPPTTQQPPPPPAGTIPMPIPPRPRQSSHPPSSYGSHHSYNTYPTQPPAYSTSPNPTASYLAPSDATTSQAMTHTPQPAYTQTHSYQQQPLPPTMAVAHVTPPHYDRRGSHASHHSHRSSHHHHHHHEEEAYVDDSSRDTSTDSAEGRRYERAERRREHRPSVGEAVYRTFKYLGGLLDPKRA